MAWQAKKTKGRGLDGHKKARQTAAQSFVAACEQSWLLQHRRGAIERHLGREAGKKRVLVTDTERYSLILSDVSRGRFELERHLTLDPSPPPPPSLWRAGRPRRRGRAKVRLVFLPPADRMDKRASVTNQCLQGFCGFGSVTSDRFVTLAKVSFG